MQRVQRLSERHGHGLVGEPSSALIDQIVLEDSHLELERAIVVFIVDEQHADEFLTDIDLGGVVLLRPRRNKTVIQ